MTVATFDSGKSEAFAGRMMSMLNDGALAIMTSIGHRAGLFDAMAEIPPSTSDQVAAAAGLHARYVREWLDAMTTGGIVEHDPEHRTYRLAPEHAAWLTRAAGPNNLAAPAQFIPLQAQVESAVLECFRGGGGLPYSAYPRFHELMAEDSAAIQDATLLDAVLPLVSGLTERLTSGVDVADVGCGTGHALNLMARAYPESRFLGWDISSEGIAAGRSEAADMGLTNVSYEVRDAATLDVHGRFAFVTAFEIGRAHV